MSPIREKLDEKIKQLNSSRVFKKVTPKYDLSWYIKWVSSILILIATCAPEQQVLSVDLWFGLFGTAGWFWVGMLWHDRALIMLNAVLVTLIFMGLLKFYLVFNKYIKGNIMAEFRQLYAIGMSHPYTMHLLWVVKHKEGI